MLCIDMVKKNYFIIQLQFIINLLIFKIIHNNIVKLFFIIINIKHMLKYVTLDLLSKSSTVMKHS